MSSTPPRPDEAAPAFEAKGKFDDLVLKTITDKDGSLVDLTRATLSRPDLARLSADLGAATLVDAGDVDLNAATYAGASSAPGLEARTLVGPAPESAGAPAPAATGIDLQAATFVGPAETGDGPRPSDAAQAGSTLVTLRGATALDAATIVGASDAAVDLSAKTVAGETTSGSDLSAATLVGPGATAQSEEKTLVGAPSGLDAKTHVEKPRSAPPRPSTPTPAVDAQGRHISAQLTVNTRTLIDRVGPDRRPGGRRVQESNAPAAAGPADYVLESVLGEGGMGIVYKAKQTSIDRPIALKMIKSKAANSKDARHKFLAEAAVTGDLDHPNIVPVYDLGVSAEGSLFYAMKAVKGKPWCDLVRKKRLGENLEIFKGVCQAIAFAHDRGIIHRDLKPENVMLGDYGEVLVMDWGLAAAITAEGKADRLPDRAPVCGTPAYMAPEMALGFGNRIGKCSDVYLLGAILFEIVAGAPPHSGETVMRCLEHAARNLIRETKEQNELLDIARKAMATRPEDRHAGAKELIEDVRLFQSHQESVNLVIRAREQSAKASASGEYNDYAETVFGFREALKLWNGNQEATDGLAAALLAYAERALVKGDLDLADSLLEGDTPKVGELRMRVASARAVRARKLRNERLLKRGVAALILLVCVVMGVAYHYIREEQEKTRIEKEKADQAKKDAVKEKVAADAARKTAETAAATARTAKEEADKATKVAAAEKENALQQTQKARAAGLLLENEHKMDYERARAYRDEVATAEALDKEIVLRLPGEAGEMKFSLVPKGDFLMGSPPNEGGRDSAEFLHRVGFDASFYMASTETTRRQWEALAGDRPPSESKDKGKGKEMTPSHPVDSVSWKDAVERFLPALQKLAPAGWTVALPTEAEWEYACRAGSPNAFASGPTSEHLSALGWSIANSQSKPHPVGRKAANAWGLFDMHGNVSEWCEDWGGSTEYEKDPTLRHVAPVERQPGKLSARVVRGGSWGVLPKFCRAAARSYMPPDTRRDVVGFRVVLRRIAPAPAESPAAPGKGPAPF